MNVFSHIKQHLSILDVISEYTTLKKAGLYWKGCCPFHHEKTPSFSVSPHKEIFYCFGCHAGGDVISFIAKIEHCSPLEAAQHAIERYQIQVPEDAHWEKELGRQEEKNIYYKTCSIFAQWCHQQLQNTSVAYNYLLDRSITQESIKNFMLGYCPSDIKGLLKMAQQEGVLAHNFVDAHILLEGRRGLYSAFDERIIFPIKDQLGRYVGFGGRVFKKDDERAKYYNSRDHKLFNKGSILYGLDRSKKVISEKEDAFLVEGYTDLIVMSQYGFTNTVATLGTACTQEHLKILSRYTNRISVVYDGDPAGKNAIMRLAELCWDVAIDPYILSLPEADDPATFLLAGGDLSTTHKEASDIFTFFIQSMGKAFATKGLQERLTIAKKIIATIHQLADPLKQDILLKQASETFSLPFDTLKSELIKLKTKKASPSYVKKESPGQKASSADAYLEISQLEKKLFSGILYYKGTISEDDQYLLRLWIPQKLQSIFEAFLEKRTKDGVSMNALFENLDTNEKNLVSRLAMELEEEKIPSFNELLVQFYKKQWKLTVHDVKLKIYQAQERGNLSAVKMLLDDLSKIKEKMLEKDVI